MRRHKHNRRRAADWKESERAAAATLLETLSWVRSGLEALYGAIDDDYTSTNLHHILRALDPASNPRLERTLAALGLELEPRSRHVTIGRIPRSANRQLRAHWGARVRDLESWRQHVRAALGRRPRPPAERVRLEITVHRLKLQDPDNAHASVKPLLDALVREGWLRDDAPAWLELEVTEAVERLKRRQRTEITWLRLSPRAPASLRQAPSVKHRLESSAPGDLEPLTPQPGRPRDTAARIPTQRAPAPTHRDSMEVKEEDR
jgi:hypothetical protein